MKFRFKLGASKVRWLWLHGNPDLRATVKWWRWQRDHPIRHALYLLFFHTGMMK